MKRSKSQLDAISYAYTKKANEARKAKIIELDGDLVKFNESKYKTMAGYLSAVHKVKYIYV